MTDILINELRNGATPKRNAHADIPRPKIIFFDIDDTLSRGGIIAEHNKRTLEMLAQTDIRLVIATGRSKSLLPADILALHDAGVFDAIICTNGQYSFDKHGIISHYPLSSEAVNHITNLCESKALIYKFDSASHLAWVRVDDRIREFNRLHSNSIVDPDYAKTHTVYQCSVFFPESEDQLQDIDFAAYNLKLVPWHSTGGDILPLNASKARGVIDVCRHFAVELTETMACGDGLNDLEMFDLVNFAVAMGDGQPALIARSDYVTGSIEEYGLQTVLDPFIK